MRSGALRRTGKAGVGEATWTPTVGTIFGHLFLYTLFVLSQNLNFSEPQLPHL